MKTTKKFWNALQHPDIPGIKAKKPSSGKRSKVTKTSNKTNKK
jgi:hypothetical protein